MNDAFIFWKNVNAFVWKKHERERIHFSMNWYLYNIIIASSVMQRCHSWWKHGMLHAIGKNRFISEHLQWKRALSVLLSAYPSYNRVLVMIETTMLRCTNVFDALNFRTLKLENTMHYRTYFIISMATCTRSVALPKAIEISIVYLSRCRSRDYIISVAVVITYWMMVNYYWYTRLPLGDYMTKSNVQSQCDLVDDTTQHHHVVTGWCLRLRRAYIIII